MYMFNRNSYYREQMKTRKVFKDSMDFMKKNGYDNVHITGNELERNEFGNWDKGLKMIQVIVIVLFLIVFMFFVKDFYVGI